MNMKKLILEVELTFDDDIMYADDEVAENWFMNNVLMNNTEGEHLMLYSHMIDDEVGTIKVISIEEA